MLGIFDTIMTLTNKATKSEIENANNFSKYHLRRKSDLTWICFLPQRTTLDIAKKYNLLPKEGNVIVYEVPLNLIASDPNITRNAFFSLIKDFEDTYKKELISKDIAFLGISIGSMPALFLANRYKAKKIRIICSTAKLGKGIFSAFSARKTKKDALKKGFDAGSYDKILAEINPIENISNLPNDIKVVVSRFDNYVPYRGGVELANSIGRIEKNAKIYKSHMIGHFLTIFGVGWLNKKCNFLG